MLQVSLVSILDFLLLAVSTTYERTVKALYLFMCRVLDDTLASWVASLPWMVEEVLFWLRSLIMQANRRFLTPKRSLDDSLHIVSSSTTLEVAYRKSAL
jgi:hypothetical protein